MDGPPAFVSRHMLVSAVIVLASNLILGCRFNAVAFYLDIGDMLAKEGL